jgi:site-specific recombinase XerD
MKNTLQTVLTISNTDIVTMLKAKEELIKSSNSKTTKNRFIIKIRSYFRSKFAKRWDENNSKDAILSAAKQLFLFITQV